jgi:hypothetical protein
VVSDSVCVCVRERERERERERKQGCQVTKNKKGQICAISCFKKFQLSKTKRLKKLTIQLIIEFNQLNSIQIFHKRPYCKISSKGH